MFNKIRVKRSFQYTMEYYYSNMKKNKMPRIKLNQTVKDLYFENYKKLIE